MVAQKGCSSCLIWLKYNFLQRPLQRPFQVWQVDFTQMPPPSRLQDGFVMICIFLQWVETFPGRRAITGLER